MFAHAPVISNQYLSVTAAFHLHLLNNLLREVTRRNCNCSNMHAQWVTVETVLLFGIMDANSQVGWSAAMCSVQCKSARSYSVQDPSYFAQDTVRNLMEPDYIEETADFHTRCYGHGWWQCYWYWSSTSAGVPHQVIEAGQSPLFTATVRRKTITINLFPTCVFLPSFP